MTVRRKLMIASGSYFLVTLGIPLLRGAYASSAFWLHAAQVFAVAGMLLVLFWMARGGYASLRRHVSGRALASPAPPIGSGDSTRLP